MEIHLSRASQVVVILQPGRPVGLSKELGRSSHLLVRLITFYHFV